MDFKGLKVGKVGLLRTTTKIVTSFVVTASLVVGTLALPSQAEGLAENFFESEAQKAEAAKQVARENQEENQPEAPLAIGSTFSGVDPQAHLTPPDARAQMRINPEAPGPFIGLATAYFSGDMQTAKAYSKQFVQYMSDLTFAVKDITRLIGEAMIEAKQINEEDWDGVEQYLDVELAKSREESGSPLKVTHEDALRKITPDSKGEVEIYYFFTLNSAHARKMAPQVERLWRVAQKDKRIKMVGLTLGSQPKEWIESYKKYTGLTLPVMNGEIAAKSFDLAFVPAIVVVTPNNPAAYVRTGQSDFSRLYQFVKKAQGQDLTMDSFATKLLQVKIGEDEKAPRDLQKVITHKAGIKAESPGNVSLLRTNDSLREKVKSLSF